MFCIYLRNIRVSPSWKFAACNLNFQSTICNEMMQWYHIVYYHVYRYYYKGNTLGIDTPWFTASLILSVSSSVYCLVAVVSFRYFILNKGTVLNEHWIMPIYFFLAAMHCAYFYYGKRFQRIYDEMDPKYNHRSLPNLLSWLFICSSFLLLILFAIYTGGLDSIPS